MPTSNHDDPSAVRSASGTLSLQALTLHPADQAVPTNVPPVDLVAAAAIQTPDRSKEEDAEAYRRLRRLQRAFGANPNKHELALTLITACILQGWDTRSRIVGTLRKLGLDHGHAVLMLTEGTGSNPSRHRWERGVDGHYRLHPEQEGTAVA